MDEQEFEEQNGALLEDMKHLTGVSGGIIIEKGKATYVGRADKLESNDLEHLVYIKNSYFDELELTIEEVSPGKRKIRIEMK